MRRWRGIVDDESEVGGDGLADARGLSFIIEGEVRRRPGFTWLASTGGHSLAAFRSPATDAWLMQTDTAGVISSIDPSTGAVASLKGSYAIDKRPVWWNAGPRVYVTNDFDRAQVWDGVWSTMRDAGIPAPTTAMGGPTSTAAGSCDIGTHLLYYVFTDSTSPGGAYRSEPSSPLTYAVASTAKALTFSIGAAATDIIRSSDSKVDTINIYMTTVAGTDYFLAQTVANSATTVVVDIGDAALELQESAAIYGETGHERPPAAAWGFESRGYVFIGGFHTRTRTVAVTNGSPTITLVSGGNFSTLWGGRLVRIGTDTATYSITTATASTLTLSKNYAGSTSLSTTASFTARSANRVYWSFPGLPESWSAADRARDVLLGSGDRLVGGIDVLGEPHFFGGRSTMRLVFTDDPGVGELVRVPGDHGCFTHESAIAVDGAVFGWGPNGIWRLYGGAPRWISGAIDPTWSELLDRTNTADIHATYDPATKTIRWHFTAIGDTGPQHAVAYDLAGDRWYIDEYRQAIHSGATVADDDGRLRLAVSDDTNNRTWVHEGDTDGVPSTSTGSYTTTVGSTTTVLQMVDSLPIGAGTDLSGTMLYRLNSAEVRAISLNTASAITVSPALATAPAAGEAIYVGSIPFVVESDWWIGQDLEDKKRAHLQLTMVPSATGSMRVYVYRDFSATPFVWTSNTSDKWPDGVTVTTGLNYLTVSLTAGGSDGFVSLPMPAEWSRALKSKVVVLDPSGTVALLDVSFGPDGRRDTARVEQE